MDVSVDSHCVLPVGNTCYVLAKRWMYNIYSKMTSSEFLLEFSGSIGHCRIRPEAISVHLHFHSCQCNLHLPKPTPQPLHGTWQTRNSRELMSHGAGVTQRSTLSLWAFVYYHAWALCCSQKGRGVSSTHGGSGVLFNNAFSLVPFFNFSIILTTFSRVTFQTTRLNLNLCGSDCF